MLLVALRAEAPDVVSHMARPAEPGAVPAPVMAQPVYCPAKSVAGVMAEVSPEPAALPKGT